VGTDTEKTENALTVRAPQRDLEEEKWRWRQDRSDQSRSSSSRVGRFASRKLVVVAPRRIEPVNSLL